MKRRLCPVLLQSKCETDLNDGGIIAVIVTAVAAVIGSDLQH